jgi:hypothetical protein
MGYLWIAVGLALGGLLKRTGLIDFAPRASKREATAHEDRMTTERRRRVQSGQRAARTRTRSRRHAAKRATA